MDFLAARKLPLIGNRFSEEIDSSKRRFTALPGKIHLFATRVDVCLDEMFKRAVIHLILMRELCFFIQIETVLTLKIALITGWFGSDMHNFSLKIKATRKHLAAMSEARDYCSLLRAFLMLLNFS